MDKRKKNFRRNAQFLALVLAGINRRQMRAVFTDLSSPLSKLERTVDVH